MTWLVRVKFCPYELRCETVSLKWDTMLCLGNVKGWKDDKEIVLEELYVPLYEVGYYHLETVKKK